MQSDSHETPERPSLWRNRNFNIFWFGQALSNLGDAFALIAIPLLVLQATGSVAQMGLVTAMFSAGWLVAGLFAGNVVDLVDRRKLLIFCDLARTLIYALIPLGWLALGPQIWLLYVVTLLGAALGICFQVAYTTAIPNLVQGEEVVEANSRLQTTWALSFVLGPMLAGFVSSELGPLTAVSINVGSFLVSAISLLLVRLRPAAAPDPAAARERPLEALLAGLRYLWRNPVLRAVTLIMAALVFVLRASDDLLIYLLKSELSQGDRQVGLLFGVSGLGAVLGGTLAPSLRRRYGFGACFLGGMAVEGLALIAVALAPSLPLVIVMATLYSLAQQVRVIAMVTVRQQVTPDHLMGRVTSAFLTLASLPGPIGITLLTALAERMGAPTIILLMGGVALTIALAGLATPARRAHPERGEDPVAQPAVAGG